MELRTNDYIEIVITHCLLRNIVYINNNITLYLQKPSPKTREYVTSQVHNAHRHGQLSVHVLHTYEFTRTWIKRGTFATQFNALTT